MSSPTSPVLPPAWGDVLENVLKTLAQVEEQVAGTENSLQDAPALPEEGLADRWLQELDRLEEHLRSLEGSVAKAEQTAAQTEEAIQLTEAALTSWLGEAEAAQRKLANWAASSV